jgi:hypothetical protein
MTTPKKLQDSYDIVKRLFLYVELLQITTYIIVSFASARIGQALCRGKYCAVVMVSLTSGFSALCEDAKTHRWSCVAADMHMLSLTDC